MNPGRLLGALLICGLTATSAAADVTLKQKVGGKGVGVVIAGESTQYIKGTRMRTDQAVGGNTTSTIIDVAAGQMIVLNHKRLEAEVYDMAEIAAGMAKISISDVKATVTPTSQTRQIANATCTVYNMQVSVPTEIGAEKLTVGYTGPACIVKNGPGQSDFAAFYNAALEKGLFFGDPRAAKAQPGQSKGMTALYREMAALGVPYAQEMNMKFEGTGMMATMMTKMGGTSITTEVVSIETSGIADSMFEIPKDYKVVKH